MKKLLVAACLMLASCGMDESIPEHSQLDIVGGQNAPYKSFYGRLEIGNRFVCGSSLIAPTWVVSAAHCIRAGETRAKVRVGAWDFTRRNNGGKRVELIGVSRVFIHPDRDLALLKLEKRSRLRPIRFSDGWDIPDGHRVQAFGFGQTSFNDRKGPRRLQGVVLKAFRKPNRNRGVIYVGRGVGKDVCFGDSGGPLVYNGALVGAASFTASQCGTHDSERRPSGYGRIDSVWIRDIMRGER